MTRTKTLLIGLGAVALSGCLAAGAASVAGVAQIAEGARTAAKLTEAGCQALLAANPARDDKIARGCRLLIELAPAASRLSAEQYAYAAETGGEFLCDDHPDLFAERCGLALRPAQLARPAPPPAPAPGGCDLRPILHDYRPAAPLPPGVNPINGRRRRPGIA